uniref:Chromo domain-containing protein n=1 Tax=Cuerna arida TaxID=1464854 RepID=A0A1B6EPS8_9HEMI
MPSDTEIVNNHDESEKEVGEEAEEYVVERIVDVRTRRGVKHYFIKWSGYPDSENTWEPEENLTCPELIEEFKRKQKEESEKRESKKRKTSPDSDAGTAQKARKDKKVKRDNAMNGFDKGYKVDKILGASETLGELHFLIKWKEVVDPEIVPAKIANVKCPAEVIKFYEQRLIWDEMFSGTNGNDVQVDGDGSDK